MKPLSFGRVLAGAALGAIAGWVAKGALHGFDWYWMAEPSLVADAFFTFIPFGAILGVRLAIGKGGTARWAALLASWGLWAGFVWILTLPEEDFPGPLLETGAAALIVGWASLVWRSMRRISGESASETAFSLASAGYFGGRVAFAVGFWAAEWASHKGLLPSIFEVVGIGMFTTVLAVALICGVGAMASLASRLDQPWTSVVASAGVVALLMFGSFFMLRDYAHRSDEWSLLPWLLLEVAWFTYWGHRLSRVEPEA